MKRNENTNWSIGLMEYWSDELETPGLRPRARGVRGKTFCLAPDIANIHYPSTPWPPSV